MARRGSWGIYLLMIGKGEPRKNLIQILKWGATKRGKKVRDSRFLQQIFYRYFSDLSQKYQISSFPYSKSYSIDRKHISDTPRHSRRVQNTILISKTYFQDEKYDFFLLKLQGKMTNFFDRFIQLSQRFTQGLIQNDRRIFFPKYVVSLLQIVF